jgi:hypothetical protein
MWNARRKLMSVRMNVIIGSQAVKTFVAALALDECN